MRSTSGAALILAIALALPAFAQNDGAPGSTEGTTTAESVLQVARAAQLAGDWQTAEQLLANVTSDPANFGDGTLRGDCLRELMISRIHLSDYEGAMDSGTAASEFFAGQDDFSAAAQTMSSLGGLLRAAGRPVLAAEAYSAALDSYARLDDRSGMASIRLSLGILADLRGELNEAVTHFSEALGLFRQLGDEQSVALCYRNLAYAHMRLGQYEQAATACQQALFIYNQLGLESLAAETHCELGEAYYELEDYKAALSECELGLGFWGPRSGNPAAAHCLRAKGLALAALDRPEEALAALVECWDLLEQSGQVDDLTELLPALAGVLGELGRSAEVESYRDRLQQAVAASTDAGNPGGY